MTPEELVDQAFFAFAPDGAEYTRYAARRAGLLLHTKDMINDALEEAAAEIEKLESGTYTSPQTPAQLVRAMKDKR